MTLNKPQERLDTVSDPVKVNYNNTKLGEFNKLQSKKNQEQLFLIEHKYGLYVMLGTEENAEKWRVREANKNCCVATKTLVDEEFIQKNPKITFYKDLQEL